MKTTTTRIPTGTTGELWHWAEEKRRAASATARSHHPNESRVTTPSLRIASGILRRFFGRLGGTR